MTFIIRSDLPDLRQPGRGLLQGRAANLVLDDATAPAPYRATTRRKIRRTSESTSRRGRFTSDVPIRTGACSTGSGTSRPHRAPEAAGSDRDAAATLFLDLAFQRSLPFLTLGLAPLCAPPPSACRRDLSECDRARRRPGPRMPARGRGGPGCRGAGRSSCGAPSER
jgi:hypothetical protein